MKLTEPKTLTAYVRAFFFGFPDSVYNCKRKSIMPIVKLETREVYNYGRSPEKKAQCNI